MIYFIQSGYFGPIKIGFTAVNAERRLNALQTATWEKLELLGIIPGKRDFEHQLHQHFKNYVIRGEWFWPVSPLIAYINRSCYRPQIEPTEPKTIDTTKLMDAENKFRAAQALKISRSILYKKPIIIRNVDKITWSKFRTICREKDLPATKKIKQLITGYVKEHRTKNQKKTPKGE